MQAAGGARSAVGAPSPRERSRSIAGAQGFGAGAGTTLVEILIGMAVLCVFVGLLYTMMGRMSRTGTIGIWRENTNREVRNASRRIRKAVGSASYPSGNTPQDSSQAANENYFVAVGPGAGGCKLETPHSGGYQCRTIEAEGEGDQTVLTVCESHPGQVGFGSAMPDKDGKVIKHVFVLRGGERIRGRNKRFEGSFVKDLCYGSATKTFKVDADWMSKGADATCIETGSAAYLPGDPEQYTRIVGHVGRVQVCTFMEGSKSLVTSHPPVGITLFCVDPHQGQAVITETIKAVPNTGVKYE